MRTISVAVAVAALIGAASVASANTFNHGTLGAVDAAQSTITMHGTTYAVNGAIDLGAFSPNQHVLAVINTKGENAVVERLVPQN